MELETRFVPWWYDPTKGSVTLFIDRVRTNVDCNHLHKTEKAGFKCHEKVQAVAHKYLSNPDLVVTPAGSSTDGYPMEDWTIPCTQPGFLSQIMRVVRFDTRLRWFRCPLT